MDLLFSLLFAALMFVPVQAQEVFVSPKGDDSNPGTLEQETFTSIPFGSAAATTTLTAHSNLALSTPACPEPP
jgi:hypothetical protein